MLEVYQNQDQEWIERCQNGEPKAQRYIYDRFAPRMYAICCRYLSTEMEAEDVLVTAFTKVFRNISQYRFQGSFEGWIRRIVINEALSIIRKNKASMILQSEYLPDDQDLTFPDSQIEADELLELIAALPTGYRTVFNLYAIEGYAHQEIAAQLGIHENTSKSQLSRARKMLRDLLERRSIQLKKIIREDEK
jgi:RNA polymerase sigma factor (sigma-70 family)